MGFARADGIEIYYREEGRGEPLLLVAGLTSPGEVFDPLIPHLAGRFRVIAPDNRGTGRTRVPGDDGERSIANFAQDLRALLDALRIERAHLFGVSMGGMIVQEFAVSWPERTGALVVGCSSPFGLMHPLATGPDTEILTLLAKTTADSPEEEVESAKITLFHPTSVAERTRAIDDYLATRRAWPHSPAEVQARLVAIARWSVHERLPALAGVPTLVLVGEGDRLIPPPNSHLVADLVPGAELVTIPRTGHVFFYEEPEATATAILDFLERHPLAEGAEAR